MTALFLAASLIAVVLVSRNQTPPVPRKNLIILVALIVVIRIGFYVAFRVFDQRDVLFGLGVVLLAMVLAGIGFGGVAVWKQMGPRER